MKDVCKQVEMPYETLKFYCNEGLVPNVKRDKTNLQKLIALDWNIITVWECEIRHTHKHNLTPLIDRVEAEILENQPKKISLKFYEQRENEVLMVAEEIVKYHRTAKK